MNVKSQRGLLLLAAIASVGNAALVQVAPSGVVASSAIPYSWASGLAAQAAINGNVTDFFSSNISTASGTQTIDLQFRNVEKNIQCVRVYPRSDRLSFPGTIKIQYDEFGDGVWKDIWTWSFPNPPSLSEPYVDLSFPSLPTDAKSIRLVASNLRADNYGNYYFQLAEIQVFREEARNDVGETRRVYPTSTFDDGAIWPSSQLIDDNLSTTYSSPISTQTQSRNCGVGFAGTMYGVSKIEIFPRPGGQCFPKAFKISYSIDGFDWSDIPGQTYQGVTAPPNGQPFVVNLRRNPINAMKIKVVSLENTADSYGNFYFQLGEIRTYVEEGMQYRYPTPVNTWVFGSSGIATPSWVPSRPIYSQGYEDKYYWDSRNIDPFDNNGAFSSPFLVPVSAPFPVQTAENSPAAIRLKYPDPVWADGVWITPASGGQGFPRDFTLYCSVASDNGAFETKVIKSFTGYLPSSSDPFKVSFTEGAKWVKEITIETSRNWTNDQGAIFQLKGLAASQILTPVSLTPERREKATFKLVDHKDLGNSPNPALKDEIYKLPSLQFIKKLRVAMLGGQALLGSTQELFPTKVEYKNASGTWVAVPETYFRAAGSEARVFMIDVNDRISELKITTGTDNPTSGSSSGAIQYPVRNAIGEITPMF